ncbi:MAG: hypothetical protein ACXABY_06645 [Candidatus Thorarchaeota archaeon]|jgi:hypothetical protein
MTFNNINQYAATHKAWDHVGNMLPGIEHCEGQRPSHDGFTVAPWLPVKFLDKYYENYLVVLPGKIISLDPLGGFMPAQYGLTGASVAYTQLDVDAGVLDVSTGLPVTAASTVTLANLDGSTGHFMGREGLAFNDATQKYPVGVCWSPMIQWAGDGGLLDDGFNPAAYRQHNYNMQHLVNPLTDYVLHLPLIPGQVSSESLPSSWTDSAAVLDGTGGWRTRANTQGQARYDEDDGLLPVLDSYPLISVSLDNRPVAKNTPRTPVSSDVTGLLVTEVESPDGIRQAGDFYIDYEVGTLMVYSVDGQTLPALAGNTITYFHNATAPGAVSSFGCVASTTTELRPGDYLKCDANSNFVRADPSSDSFFEVIGQVLALDSNHPKDYLDRVRTAFSPALATSALGTLSNGTRAVTLSQNRGQLDQLTGSATGGMPTLLTYAGGADTIVLINLIGK